jgi:hypothetical protein
MKKTAIIVAATAAAAIAVPVFASTQNESSSVQSSALLPNQIEFIRLVDKEAGTNFYALKDDPTVVSLVRASTGVCNNISLQKQVISALGGTAADATYASNKFQTVFCNSY